MKRRSGHARGRVAMFCAMAVVAFTGLTGVALATGETSATLEGGELNISSALTAGTFNGTLDGHAKVLDGSEAFTGFSINDPRGTGVGWDVTMQATVFDNATEDGKDLAANSLTMPLLAVAKADAGSSDVPGTLHAAATVDTGVAGVVMAECYVMGQGMGTYNFTSADTVPWKLALTADEYAGTYNSPVTTTLATLALSHDDLSAPRLRA